MALIKLISSIVILKAQIKEIEAKRIFVQVKKADDYFNLI